MAKDAHNILRSLSKFDDMSNLYADIAPKQEVQRNILKLEIKKQTAAASTLPGMIAPSVFFFFLAMPLSLSVNPTFTRMAACQM